MRAIRIITISKFATLFFFSVLFSLNFQEGSHNETPPQEFPLSLRKTYFKSMFNPAVNLWLPLKITYPKAELPTVANG